MIAENCTHYKIIGFILYMSIIALSNLRDFAKPNDNAKSKNMPTMLKLCDHTSIYARLIIIIRCCD